MREQSWAESWALLEQINPDYHADSRHLGALREDFELLAATVLRHRGQIDAAQKIYEQVLKRLSLQDERLADLLLGLAECEHCRGDFDKALKVMRAAERIPVSSHILAVRVHTAGAHIASHVRLEEALARFAWIRENFTEQEHTAWANLLFWHGDALLVNGSYQESIPVFIAAHQMALKTGATITAADAMRRLPLARILCGQTDYALRGVGDLAQAKQLYELAGDRGVTYLHTEAGEVHRAIGQWREAERSFTQGLWASRSIQDHNRVAHNQMGLFEISRATGTPKMDLLDQAFRSYDLVQSDWGKLHVHISRALADGANRAEHMRNARELIGRTRFSSFTHEQQLLGWMGSASAEQISREPHLMNYP